MKHKPLPSIETLNELLQYDSESGKLTHKTNRGKAVVGREAGNVKPNKCIYVEVNQSKYLAHRLIWKMHTGNDPGDMTIDHIDRDRSNNKINNLRLASREIQTHNRDMKGVYQCKRTHKWRGQIYVKGKAITSTHECPLMARLWYLDKKAEYHPCYTHK